MTAARILVAVPAAADPEAFMRRHLRRNILALGADFGLFLVALSFASYATILPAFAAHLGAPNVVIGAIPAVMTAGWYLPALFVAGRTEALARKLPFVLRYTLWERLPVVVLALVAFFLAGPLPGLAQAVLLVMLLVMTGVGGLLMPAWMDVVGRSVPQALRGRFFAGASLLGSAGGLLGGAATTYILAAIAAPASYGVCFLASALFMALSYAALAATREPPTADPRAAVALGTYLARIPAILRGDRNLSWFLVARGFAAFGMMSAGFYAVYALRDLGVPEWRVGVFTTAFFVGQTGGNLVLGWLADRHGHRLVIIWGIAATVVANVVALGSPSPGLFALVFALSGVQYSAITVSWLNVLLEFAPSAAERPTYVGLGSTGLAPAAFAAPLVAGAMADALGFRSVFVAALVFGLIALALLLARVRDPRHGLAASRR